MDGPRQVPPGKPIPDGVGCFKPVLATRTKREGVGLMASSLRDDLASLKIDRHNPKVELREAARAERPRRDLDRPRRRSGVGLATILLWLIPLSLLGTAGAIGYREFE